MRLYIHETAQGPLPDSELLALSTSNLPPVPAQLLCQTADALRACARPKPKTLHSNVPHLKAFGIAVFGVRLFAWSASG